MTTIIYPMIAEKYDTILSRVERAIQHAIETTWFKSNHFDFDHSKEKPMNSEFIVLLAEKLRLKNEEEIARMTQTG